MLHHTRKVSLFLFALISACATNETPFAPLSDASSVAAGRSDEHLPPRMSVCHLLDDGTFKAMELPANAVDAHLAHGDQPAGGPELDANCQPWPFVFRDEFNGPLDPNRWSLLAESRIENGTITFFGDIFFSFRPYDNGNRYTPHVAWEFGWIVAPSLEYFSRVASGCMEMCNPDINEAFSRDDVFLLYEQGRAPDPTFSPRITLADLTPGPHVFRADWNRDTGIATYWVDGNLMATIPTTFGWQPGPPRLSFYGRGSVTLTYFQYEIIEP
jgi:hypothetical protein